MFTIQQTKLLTREAGGESPRMKGGSEAIFGG